MSYMLQETKQLSDKINLMQNELDTKFNRIHDVIGEKEKRRQKFIKDRDQLLKLKVSLKDEVKKNNAF